MPNPKELSSAWWKSKKGKTVKDQGLEKALKEWEKITKDSRPPYDPPTISRASYHKVKPAVIGIVDTAGKTIAKCNGKFHKESIGYCEHFIKIAQKAENKMKVDQKKYESQYNAFIKEHKDALKKFTDLLKIVDKVKVDSKADSNKEKSNVFLDNIEERKELELRTVRDVKHTADRLHKDDYKEVAVYKAAIFKLSKQLMKSIDNKRDSLEKL